MAKSQPIKKAKVKNKKKFILVSCDDEGAFEGRVAALMKEGYVCVGNVQTYYKEWDTVVYGVPKTRKELHYCIGMRLQNDQT